MLKQVKIACRDKLHLLPCVHAATEKESKFDMVISQPVLDMLYQIIFLNIKK